MKKYTELYDPQAVLQDPEFKVLSANDKIGPNDNIAAMYNPKHEIHLVKKATPKPREGEVLIKVRATGICGSDVHFWKHGHIGDMVVTDECGSGHESAGEILEVGQGVTTLKKGDRVAIEAGVPCGICELCLEGKYNACPDVVFFSTPPYHGTLSRFHAHPANWCHKLPDSMSFEEGSLCEPLSVALAAIDRAGLKLGDPLLITVSLLAARAAGCTPIVITDLAESRLAFAKKLVPSVVTVQVDRNLDAQAQAKKVKEAAGMKLHVALECTGVESSIHTACYSLKFGSTVMVVGLAQPVWKSFPMGYCSGQEIDIKFLFRYANQYPKAIRLVSAGLVDLKPLVTHRFKIEDAVDAFETAADITKGSIKCQIIAD